MNIHQLRCAVTVARLGSQTRAAEALYMSQPNLSKALKDLEQASGVHIFNRTGSGMTPTRQGEAFLERARALLQQMDAMDAIYQGQNRSAARLNVSVPRAGYITRALASFVNAADLHGGVEISVREGGAYEVMHDVVSREADIGIVRYNMAQQNKMLGELAEQGLHYILYWSFTHAAVMSQLHPLARQAQLQRGQLLPYVEVLNGDMPSPVELDASSLEALKEPRRQIRAYERASQLELLSRCPSTYLWDSPVPEDMLKRFGLVQLRSEEAAQPYQDALVYIKGYSMSRWEQAFYDAVHRETERL